MCGIAGIAWQNAIEMENGIVEMVRRLQHRGPDGEGIYQHENVAIGHRRLSIIDPVSGKQPMSNEDGTLWVTYNGEIYNFRELKRDLEARGHSFRTHSDTEVVIHSYAEWGDDCVKRFRGMFAFGIVDVPRRRIFLARDQLGIKPLLYYSEPGRFAFASEMQALRALPGVKLDLDLRALDQYLWLQYIPAPYSIFRQVRKLPPACRMSVSFDGEATEPEEYWDLTFSPDYRKSKNDWLEELDQTLRDSVRDHLVSDVPFGAFLSGGVDSSMVVAYMAQLLDKPVRTFSIGFEEPGFDETAFAKLASDAWRTEHHVEMVKPDALGILPSLVQHYGEPFGDSSAIPTYYVSKLARQSVPMVLSGDGGDEAFAGYHSHLAWLAYLHERPRDDRPVWKKAMHPIMGRLFPKRYPPRSEYGDRLENWLAFVNYMPGALRHRLWRREYRAVERFPLDVFEKAFDRAGSFSAANKVQYMDIKTYLPFDILTKVDTASMMHSLEVRTPLVDVKVMEFAATIPESFNVERSESGEWHGKRLLKNLMERYYPKEFLNRKKMGFAVPIQKWFTTEGSCNAEIMARLLGERSPLRDYFELTMVKKIVESNSSGLIWLLLFLDEWLAQNSIRT